MDKRIEDVTGFAEQLRKSGAGKAIPYLSTMLMIGNPDTREGFWDLYDRWEDFEALGLGPKPATDPVEWICKKHVALPQNEEIFVYEPSIAHPDWQKFLCLCAEWVARTGYDGAFLDVNSTDGQTEWDRQLFGKYLSGRYSAEEMSELFGFDSVNEVAFGETKSGLLWAETQRFRTWEFGELFAMIRDAGKRHTEDFFVIPNESGYGSMEAYYTRRSIGHSLTYSHIGCEMTMFEEMQQPGRFGMDRISDFILPYRSSLAHGMQGVVLQYHAGDLHGQNLANAEAAAAGGGAFVQPGFEAKEHSGFWTDWFDRHADRVDGLDSVHDVGLMFFAEQGYWDHRAHIDSVFRIRHSLSDNHILFDVLVEPHFTTEGLSTFEAVIVPEVRYMSQIEMDALLHYVAGGGKLLIIGECGKFDERGQPSAVTLKERMAAFPTRVACFDTLEELLPNRGIEIFDLSEDDFNEIKAIFDLPDRVSSPEEAQAARRVPLTEALETLAAHRLRKLDDDSPYTLRVSAFRHPNDGRVIVHLVNYDLPVVGRGKSSDPIPAENIRVGIPAKSAKLWTAEGVDGDDLLCDDDGFVVPQVTSYAMVEIA